MILKKIYKKRIEKVEKKLFDLGGGDLIELQEKYIKIIQKIFEKRYNEVLDYLEKDPEVKLNDSLIDQSQFVEKITKLFEIDLDEEDITEMITMFAKWYWIWIIQMSKIMSAEVTTEALFGLDPAESLVYAEEHAWELITRIDEYSRKRINNLISNGVEKWWGYNKLAKELRGDYAFSAYRSRLIASNEIGTAYIEGKDAQFKEYKKEFGQTGWKNWISHRDDVTTANCLANDNQGWIEHDQLFQSWDEKPPRFPWCRCNITYRLFNPNE